MAKQSFLLAGDVGGTKTILALFEVGGGSRDAVAESTFPSADYGSLEAMAAAFLGAQRAQAAAACFGVAGPVVGGRVRVTNLPWVIDAGVLKDALGLRAVHLINDLAALACAVPALEAADLETLYAGEAVEHGTLAVVAPGTGLGEAFLTWDGSRYHVHPSEGGHSDFAPTSDLEDGLLRYLRERFGHASYDRICSGKGLPLMYAYLRDCGQAREPEAFAREMAGAGDSARLIVASAIGERERFEICEATLNLFMSILGSEAGNMVLKVMATGGLYLGGGIPPRILPQLKAAPFLDAFLNKGRLSDVVKRTPVRVILNTRAALLGAARYGMEMAGTAGRRGRST